MEWKMRGCSDNVHFGSQVAQQLLDATEAGTDSVSMANLHNNEAGRVAVKRKMRYVLLSIYSKAPRYTDPRCTDPIDTRF